MIRAAPGVTSTRDPPKAGPVGRRMLDRQQDSAGPFPAEPDPLQEPQQHQDRRREQADAAIPRQHADADGGTSATISIDLRPIRSPKCPNNTAPTGRTTNAAANVAKAASVPLAGDNRVKYTVPKTRAAAWAYSTKS